MSDVLVAATVLSLLFAVLMTVIAAKLLRESRTRTTSRVEALQALSAEPASIAPTMTTMTPAVDGAATAPMLPAFQRPPASGPQFVEEDEWDFTLRDEPPTPISAPVQRSQPVPDLPPARAVARVRQSVADVRVSHPPVSSFGGHAFDLRGAQSAPEHDLFEAAVPSTPTRRWSWMAAAAIVMGLGGGTFYLISSGVIARAFAAHDANMAMANTRPIELLSLRYTADGGNFVVTGLVQNPPASVSLHGVFAVVYLFDAEGKFISSARASLETSVLSPGGEATFVVRVPAATDVTRYRVSFQHEDGAAVQHVDRRGALPANTTGDAIQAPATAPVITARKNG